MTGFRVFTISDEAARQAEQIGISRTRLAELARFAAPFSHPEANRRNGCYLLRVAGGVVEAVLMMPGLPDGAGFHQGDPLEHPDLARPVVTVKRKLTRDEVNAIVARHTSK